MKIKKIVIIIIAIIILSGCSGEVNIVIDENDNISQSIKTITEKSDLDFFGQTEKEYISSSYEFNDSKRLRQYEKEEYDDGENFGVIFSKESDNICDEFKNSYFSSFFNNIECTDSNNYYEIYATTNYLSCSDDCDEPPELKDVKLTVELPQKAIKNNADEVNGTRYTWYYENGNGIFELKFKKNRKDNNIKKSFKLGKGEIIFLSTLIVFVIVVISILLKKYKKNKLDY